MRDRHGYTMSSMRRRIICIVAAIVLGVVSGAVVPGAVFGLMMTLGRLEIQSLNVHDRTWNVSHATTPTGEMVSAGITAEGLERTPARITDHRLPWWSLPLHRPQFTADQCAYNRVEFAVGWPYLSLHTGYEMDDFCAHALHMRELPFRALWPGLIANFAMHTFAWLLLLQSPSALRYVRRRRRGHCLSCGYDLRATTTTRCSECGSDQLQLQRTARRDRRVLFAVTAVVAMIVAVPTGQAWRRAMDKEAAFATGWLDELLSESGFIVSTDRDRELAERVYRLPGHEDVIADRLENMSTDEMWTIISFLETLILLDPKEAYLRIVDRMVEIAPSKLRWQAFMLYRWYPWSTIGERVTATYEMYAADDALLASVTVTVVDQSWTMHSAPHSRNHVESLLRTILDDPMGPPALQSLRRLIEWEWIDVDQARVQLGHIVERDPDSQSDPAYGYVRDAIANRTGSPPQ